MSAGGGGRTGHAGGLNLQGATCQPRAALVISKAALVLSKAARISSVTFGPGPGPGLGPGPVRWHMKPDRQLQPHVAGAKQAATHALCCAGTGQAETAPSAQEQAARTSHVVQDHSTGP